MDMVPCELLSKGILNGKYEIVGRLNNPTLTHVYKEKYRLSKDLVNKKSASVKNCYTQGD
jgi:hypothetical protein